MTDTKIQAYTETAAKLASLREAYEGRTFDCTTTDGLKCAQIGRQELRTYRVKIESIRVDLKAPLLEMGRQIDAEAKRITGEIESLEEPIDRQIKAEEARKAKVREEKARAEREALEAQLRAQNEARRAADEAAAKAERERLAAERATFEAEVAVERAKLEAAEKAAALARFDANAKAEEALKAQAEKLAAERFEIGKRERAVAAAEAEARRVAAVEQGQRDAVRIATATLLGAAREAVTLLQACGHANHVTTLALRAAVDRETAATSEPVPVDA